MPPAGLTSVVMMIFIAVVPKTGEMPCLDGTWQVHGCMDKGDDQLVTLGTGTEVLY